MNTLIEQETTVAAGRADAVVYVYSTVPKHLRKLRGDKRVTEVEGGDGWGRFEIPADQFDPLRGFKRATRQLTDEQRKAVAERFRKARLDAPEAPDDGEDG
jgi:hypothetical protein